MFDVPPPKHSKPLAPTPQAQGDFIKMFYGLPPEGDTHDLPDDAESMMRMWFWNSQNALQILSIESVRRSPDAPETRLGLVIIWADKVCFMFVCLFIKK